MGVQPTRQGLLKALSQGKFDLDGFQLAYGPGNNQGSDKVFLTVIRPDGTFAPVDRLTPATSQG